MYSDLPAWIEPSEGDPDARKIERGQPVRRISQEMRRYLTGDPADKLNRQMLDLMTEAAEKEIDPETIHNALARE